MELSNFLRLNTQLMFILMNMEFPIFMLKMQEMAYQVLGYVHAQDRLFQMEMMRRLGAGELAEILGPDLANNDRFFRTLGGSQTAKKAAEAFRAKSDNDPVKQAALAYYKGVNSFIKKGNLPIEFTILGFEPKAFDIEDTYEVFAYMAFSFAQAFKTDPLLTRIQSKYGSKYLNDLDVHWNEAAEMIPVYSPPLLDQSLSEAASMQELLADFPIPPFIGSNSWVVGPSKTKNGKVLLSNDTHIGFAQPSVWYEAHVVYPGYNHYGNYLGGIPFPVLGHNEYQGIGVTMFENDDIDFYKEEINPNNPNQVKYKGEWTELKTRKEVIKVKDGDDIAFDVKITPHGPIMNEALTDISKTTNDPISCYWIFNQFIPESLEMSYQIANAKTMDEVRAAVKLGHAPGLNIMYGDVNGNIAWWTMGKLPIRPAHVNSKLILDGASGKDDIMGYHDFSENPQSENPPSGFVYSANNQPDTMAGVLQPGYYIPEDRAQRIVDLLSTDKKWDMDGFKTMITDATSPVMPSITKHIVKAVTSTIDPSTIEKEALAILSSWNGDNQLTDLAPTIYMKTLFHILDKTYKDELGSEDFDLFLTTHIYKRSFPILIEQLADSPWWDNIETKDQVENKTSILADAFQQAVMELERDMGEDIKKWTWGKVHSIEHPHPLGQVEALKPYFNVGPFPIAGNNEVINNLQFQLNGNNKYEVKGGPALRRIIDFGDVEHSISVLPTGQSGNVMSPHYSDQAQLFVNNQFRLQMTNESEIKEKAKNKLSFQPK